MRKRLRTLPRDQSLFHAQIKLPSANNHEVRRCATIDLTEDLDFFISFYCVYAKDSRSQSAYIMHHACMTYVVSGSRRVGGQARSKYTESLYLQGVLIASISSFGYQQLDSHYSTS